MTLLPILIIFESLVVILNWFIPFFGLYQSYGSAQQLYIEMGYQPDGQEITYHSDSVIPVESYPVDDELLLWLTKSI